MASPIDPSRRIIDQLGPSKFFTDFGNAPSGVPIDGTNFDKIVPAGVHYEAMSGVDMTAMIVLPEFSKEAMARMGVFKEQSRQTVKMFAELQTLSISSTRSFGAVRRLGEVQAAAYTRGGRTIAGTMVFTAFNRDVFAELYSIHPEDTFDPGVPMHVDQIPEFNILIQGTNEYGAMVNSGLVGVSLLNFGTTLSINDLMIESTYTYVARMYYPMVSNVHEFHNAIMKHFDPRQPEILGAASGGSDAQFWTKPPLPPGRRNAPDSFIDSVIGDIEGWVKKVKKGRGLGPPEFFK